MKETVQKLWESLCTVLAFNVKKTSQNQLPEKRATPKVALLVKLEEYLFGNHYFRYNIPTGETEYKEKKTPVAEFKVIGHREQNTLCIDAQANGVNCWDRDLQRILYSNRKDLLTNTAGSRRFICVEVADKIDCTGIEHDQIYSQLRAELQASACHWLTDEEERELQLHNRTFYQQSPVEEVFYTCFRAARKNEECELLSAAEIFKFLKKHNSAAMRGANPASFARIIPNLGIERKHTKHGNVYKIVSLV